MTRGWFCGEPFHPFFVHAFEIIFFYQEDSSTYNFGQGTASGRENCGDVRQALFGLFLDRGSDDGSRFRIVWAGARDKDQPSGPYRLAIHRWRFRRVLRVDDLARQLWLR